MARTANLTGFLDTAKAANLNAARLLQLHGLTLAALSDPNVRAPLRAMAGVLDASAEASGWEDFGLRMIESRRVSDLGVLWLLAREQATQREAVRAVSDRIWMNTEGLSVSLVENNGIGLLRMDLAEPGIGRQMRELTVGVAVHSLRALFGASWRPQAVLFAHRAPRSIETHRRMFGLAPLFEQEVDGVELLTSELDERRVGADAALARVLEAHLERFVQPPSSGVIEQVRDTVVTALLMGRCTSDRVAASLGLNRRGLHRRLAAHGATFREIVDTVRGELADAYLAEGSRTLTEISQRLGYRSLSAFSRWRRERESDAERPVAEERTA